MNDNQNKLSDGGGIAPLTKQLSQKLNNFNLSKDELGRSREGLGIKQEQQQNLLTDSFIDEYLGTGEAEQNAVNFIEIGGQKTDRSALTNPFEYQSGKNKMTQLTLINNTNTTANTKSTENKSRNNIKLKAGRKQINAFMYNSSDNVSPSTTQINSRLGAGAGSGSISPAITSYSNGASTSNLKHSLFHMESSQIQSSQIHEHNSPNGVMGQNNSLKPALAIYQSSAPQISMFQNKILPQQQQIQTPIINLGLFDKKKKSIEIIENIKSRINLQSSLQHTQMSSGNNQCEKIIVQNQHNSQNIGNKIICHNKTLIPEKPQQKITFLGKFVKLSKKNAESKQQLNQLNKEAELKSDTQNSQIQNQGSGKTILLNKTTNDALIRKQILQEYNLRKVQNQQTYSNAFNANSQQVQLVREIFCKSLLRLAINYYQTLMQKPHHFLIEANEEKVQNKNRKLLQVSFLEEDDTLSDSDNQQILKQSSMSSKKAKVIWHMSQKPMSTQAKQSKAFTFQIENSNTNLPPTYPNGYQHKKDMINISNSNKKINILQHKNFLEINQNKCENSLEVNFQRSGSQDVLHSKTIQLSQNTHQDNNQLNPINSMAISRGKRFEDFLPPQKRQNSKSKLRKIISNVKI